MLTHSLIHCTAILQNVFHYHLVESPWTQKYRVFNFFPQSTEPHKSIRDLKQIQIKVNTRLTVVL